MRKATKIWLIVAASLLLVGLMIFGSVMTMLAWDFSKLSTVKYEENTYPIGEKFTNIFIVSDTADIVFVPTEDARGKVVCLDQSKVKHSVTVTDDTLIIKLNDTRRWYEHIGIGFRTPKITVYTPRAEYGALQIKSHTGNVTIPADFSFDSMDITQSTGHVTNNASVLNAMKIKTSTGNISVKKVSAGTMNLSVTTGRVIASNVSCTGNVEVRVSTGDARLTNISCNGFSSSGNTGELSLKNVIAQEAFAIVRSTGDVEFDDCDADTLWIKTDTGDVEGTLRSAKIFMTKTDTGEVDVPKTTTGGVCQITTDTGDIEIRISK